MSEVKWPEKMITFDTFHGNKSQAYNRGFNAALSQCEAVRDSITEEEIIDALIIGEFGDDLNISDEDLRAVKYHQAVAVINHLKARMSP